MSKSKINKLARTGLVGVITKRLSTVGKASDAPAKDLLDYDPNTPNSRVRSRRSAPDGRTSSDRGGRRW